MATDSTQRQADVEEIAPLNELKDLFTEIQRNMDKNLELAGSIERFRDIVGALNRRYLAQEGKEG